MKNVFYTLVTFLLVSFGMVNATNTETNSRYFNGYGNTFTFVEGNITFSIFQNGEFDFYLNKRNGFNVNYNSSNVNISFNSGYNYDAYVQYDDFGAVIQIENIPIYYDYYGRIDRIGNVNINYRNGRLIRFGGMHVYYNSYGNYSYYRGYINRYNRNYVYHPYHNCFVRPFYEYRVVSYKPYRHYYKTYRYAYHKDHSRNKYYKRNNGHNKYNKRDNYSTRRRVATSSIPKKSRAYYASNNKRNLSAEGSVKNTRRSYNQVENNSSRRGSIAKTRNNTTVRNIKNTSVQHNSAGVERRAASTVNRNATIRTQRLKSYSERRGSTVRTKQPSSTKSRRVSLINRKSVKVNQRRNTVQNKSNAVVKRHSVTRKVNKTVSLRKRRG